jgi:glucan phosphoethanolaminetransferase (alkaline phosphatase superfamily)
MKKNGIFLGTFGFFFGVSRLGLINKLFFTVIICQGVAYWYKCSFYQLVMEDLATHMTLTGQETRIQIRYRLPQHENLTLF